MTSIQLRKIAFLMLFWICCTIFITFYDASIEGFHSREGIEEFNFLNELLINIIVTIAGSSILGSLEILVFNKLFRKWPFGLSLIIKTAIYVFFILFFVSIAFTGVAGSRIERSFFHNETIRLFLEYIASPRFIMSIAYWGIACILALFILQVSEKFGQGVLINFLLGKYHRPKEENQIFMFMDLRSSTLYAEKLGHIRYSQFIQDCFYDITDMITKYRANIYQYVGDEVVLNWNVHDGIRDGNCIQIFFEFDQYLKKRKDYYQSKYDVIPEFKAGVNIGIVTAVEVGVLRLPSV